MEEWWCCEEKMGEIAASDVDGSRSPRTDGHTRVFQFTESKPDPSETWSSGLRIRCSFVQVHLAHTTLEGPRARVDPEQRWPETFDPYSSRLVPDPKTSPN